MNRTGFARALALAATATALAVIVAGCAFNVREDHWFHPESLVLDAQQLAALPLPEGYRAEMFTFAAADGTQLAALHVGRDADAPAVFYLGGDTFKIARHGLEIAPVLAGLGLDVFMVDYRGYGGSAGSPSIDTLMSDAEDALAVLRGRLGHGRPVLVHGFSLGSFVGAELARRRAVQGLVLESSATSVRDWANHQVPWYGKPFVSINLATTLEAQSNAVRVADYSGPLLLIAGGADDTTPADMSRALFEASASPRACRRLMVAEEAGHGNALAFAETLRAYRDFIDVSMPACGR